MSPPAHSSQPFSWLISLIGRCHEALVFRRRTQTLAQELAARIPQGASVLDIGCGDGTIASLIAHRRPGVSIQGVEYMVRPNCKIDCRPFNGCLLPFADGSFEVCLLVDVLHHTQDPSVLLREAARVARSFILMKDHVNENIVDHITLRFMDWVGNRPHGVPMTYNYQSARQWDELFSNCRLAVERRTRDVALYPWPFHLIVGRGLHFIALLRKTA